VPTGFFGIRGFDGVFAVCFGGARPGGCRMRDQPRAQLPVGAGIPGRGPQDPRRGDGGRGRRAEPGTRDDRRLRVATSPRGGRGDVAARRPRARTPACCRIRESSGGAWGYLRAPAGPC